LCRKRGFLEICYSGYTFIYYVLFPVDKEDLQAIDFVYGKVLVEQRIEDQCIGYLGGLLPYLNAKGV
jgi:hypothetical protein